MKEPRLSSPFRSRSASARLALCKSSNGSGFVECGFDLAAGVVTPGAGVAAQSLTNLGNGFFELSMSCEMAAGRGADPRNIARQPGRGTLSYAGTAGDGLFFWGRAIFGRRRISVGRPAVYDDARGGRRCCDHRATPNGTSGLADPNWGRRQCLYFDRQRHLREGRGRINGPARQGVLTAVVAAPNAQPDETNVMAVSLIERRAAPWRPVR